MTGPCCVLFCPCPCPWYPGPPPPGPGPWPPAGSSLHMLQCVNHLRALGLLDAGQLHWGQSLACFPLLGRPCLLSSSFQHFTSPTFYLLHFTFLITPPPTSQANPRRGLQEPVAPAGPERGRRARGAYAELLRAVRLPRGSTAAAVPGDSTSQPAVRCSEVWSQGCRTSYEPVKHAFSDSIT